MLAHNVSVIFTLSLVLYASAAVTSRDFQNVKCNTGPIQCCNSLKESHDHALQHALGVLGLLGQQFDGSVGVQCSPVTAFGLGGGQNCNAQPVCCENDSFNGLIAFGCDPININL